MRVNALYLHRYVATPAQTVALEAICQEWSATPNGFWTYQDVVDALKRQTTMVLFVAESSQSRSWCGAIMLDIGPFSADVLYIYVRSEYRRMRVGNILLQGAITAMRMRPAVEELFLVVRANNQAAVSLYESRGFQRVGIRKAYYRNGDDALVYRLELVGEK